MGTYVCANVSPRCTPVDRGMINFIGLCLTLLTLLTQRLRVSVATTSTATIYLLLSTMHRVGCCNCRLPCGSKHVLKPSHVSECLEQLWRHHCATAAACPRWCAQCF